MAVAVRGCRQSLVRTTHLLNEGEEGSGMMLDNLTTPDETKAQGRHAACPGALHTALE